MNRRRLWLGLIIGVAGLALFTLPWWSPPLYLTLSIRIMFFGLLAISLSFLAGQLNKISLTQTAFFGVAAYSIAILGVKHNIPFPYPALVGLGLAILLAALFGLVATRSSGIYFIMITLALGQLTWALSNQWLSMTGGYDGIPGIRAPTVWGIPFVNPKNFYFALLVVWPHLARHPRKSHENGSLRLSRFLDRILGFHHLRHLGWDLWHLLCVFHLGRQPPRS